MCFDETDQIQHKISANELKAKPIYCKQCNNVFDKKKIKCDENLRHGTSLFEPISTRIVPQKNEKQVKSTNQVESCTKDDGVGLKSRSEYHSPRNATLEHPLCSIKCDPKHYPFRPRFFVNPAQNLPSELFLIKLQSMQE